MSAEVTERGSFLSVSAVAAATKTGEEDGILCNRSAVTTLGPVVLKSDVSRGHIGAPRRMSKPPPRPAAPHYPRPFLSLGPRRRPWQSY